MHTGSGTFFNEGVVALVPQSANISDVWMQAAYPL